MNKMGISVIVGFIVVFIILYERTPDTLSHMSWRMKFKKAYKIDGESGYRVIRYHHDKTDGVRLRHTIAHKKLPRMVQLKHPPDQCHMWTRVRVRDTALNGSPFLKLVTLFICHSKQFRENLSLYTCIPVSTRDKLPEQSRMKAGCFLRMAFTRISLELSPQQILDAHSTQIKNIKKREKLVDNLSDRVEIGYTNYIFNKWMLDTIPLPDGRTMKLHCGGVYISPENLLNIQFPMEIKCISDGDGVWTLLVTPYWWSAVH